MSDRRQRRQVMTHFLAKRLDLENYSTESDMLRLWPFSFLHDMILKKHESWKYLIILNEALEWQMCAFVVVKNNKYLTLTTCNWPGQNGI